MANSSLAGIIPFVGSLPVANVTGRKPTAVDPRAVVVAPALPTPRRVDPFHKSATAHNVTVDVHEAMVLLSEFAQGI